MGLRWREMQTLLVPGRVKPALVALQNDRAALGPASAINGLSVYGASRLGKSFQCIFSSRNIEFGVFIFRGLGKNYVSYFQNKQGFYRGVNAELWYPAHLRLSPPPQSLNVACVPQALLVKIFT